MSERGSSLAWAAIFMSMVLVLAALVGDGARLFYVRNRLNAAVTAACEDAAWSAADRILYQQTGQINLSSERADLAAQSTFAAITADRIRVRYLPGLDPVMINRAAGRVNCVARASVPMLVPLPGAPNPVVLYAHSTSRLRFHAP